MDKVENSVINKMMAEEMKAICSMLNTIHGMVFSYIHWVHSSMTGLQEDVAKLRLLPKARRGPALKEAIENIQWFNSLMVNTDIGFHATLQETAKEKIDRLKMCISRQ